MHKRRSWAHGLQSSAAMNLQNIAVAVALSLALAAGCKKPANETDDNTRTTSAMPNVQAPANAPNQYPPQGSIGTTETTGATTVTMASSDVDFMKKAALGGMLEVKLGNEAANRATRPEVKAFASHMVTDHTKINGQLKDLAAKKNVILPTQLDDEHSKMMTNLLKLSGPQFDDRYMKAMVEDHEKDVKEFQRMANDAKDPDLKQWVAATLPTLTSHLEMAREVEGKKGAASVGTHPR
jgi:putative membrane protein